MKITHPVTRSAFGIVALAAIAILANWLVSLTPLGNRGADFTQNKIHTLSDGTRAILAELDTPLVIRYYATRKSNYVPEQLKLHMRRVDDLLKEYTSLSNGKIRIENLDPEPDTDSEDAANLDGISGQRIDDQNLYFGMAISCLDHTSVIPFINPNDETMLEYQLSKAISDVITPNKPKIGVMSALNLKGSPAMMPGQRGTPPWMVYQQLCQSYQVVDIPLDSTSIDASSIKALFVFHPAGITPTAEFAIDQYVLQGGTVIACLDAYSMAAQNSPSSNPMMGMNGAPPTSTFPTLLNAWGLKFESSQVLADPQLASPIGPNQKSITVLSVTQKNMPIKDSIITKNIEAAVFYMPGGFTRTGGGGVTSNSLIKSTTGSGFVDPLKASRNDPFLATSFRSSGSAYDILVHLQGNFKSAFPNGNPSADPTEKKSDATPAPAPSLKEATKPGNVFLFADVDAFFDSLAYNVIPSLGYATPRPNASLLFNLFDQAVGSKHLIGSRSRSAIRRPFTVIQTMEEEFTQNTGNKIKEFESKQKEAMDKIAALQASRSKNSGPLLSPEQEAELVKLRKEQVEYAKRIRNEQKDLRRQKDRLAGKITLLNVCAVPCVVILFGLGLFFQRRRATSAR